MRRREVIALLGGAAVAWPLAARAQQAAMPVVALISGRSRETAVDLAAEFRKGLSQTGRTDGQNVVVEDHWLEGHYERVLTLIDDVVRRGVALIATPANSPATLAAKAATSTIPIVFGVGEDPVELGLVASLAEPDEMLPKAKRFAVLINPANGTTAEATSKALEQAARVMGLELVFFRAGTSPEIDAAFAAIARERVDALFIAPDAYFAARAAQLGTLAMRERIPASAFSRENVEVGMLMSYGTSIADVFRQVGIYAGSILNGTKPAELPVLQSTKFEFIINLQTAHSLGVDIPPTLLARADEVIE
jgi:putative tryptophan/tyrosine transport system substrate-binding protein